MMMMVPVAYVAMPAAQQQQRECKETVVTTEYVTVRTPPRYRYIPLRPRPVPDKRVRIAPAPDKRVRM
jgi:hypothetical protein